MGRGQGHSQGFGSLVSRDTSLITKPNDNEQQLMTSLMTRL